MKVHDKNSTAELILPSLGAGNCTKCRGFVTLKSDRWGPYMSCMNCGKMWYSPGKRSQSGYSPRPFSKEPTQNGTEAGSVTLIPETAALPRAA